MSEKGLKMVGKDPNSNAKAVRTDEDGNIGVQLSKSKAEFIILLGSLQIRDTSNYDSNELSIAQLDGYNNFFIEVSNGLNVPVDIRLRRAGTWFYDIKTVNANRPAVFTPEDFKGLYLPGGNRSLTIRATAKSEPITGALSVWLHAMP